MRCRLHLITYGFNNTFQFFTISKIDLYPFFIEILFIPRNLTKFGRIPYDCTIGSLLRKRNREIEIDAPNVTAAITV